MKKKTWFKDGNEMQLDSADEIARFYAAQAITNAQGRLQNGNIPLHEEPGVEEPGMKETIVYRDTLHL